MSPVIRKLTRYIFPLLIPAVPLLYLAEDPYIHCFGHPTPACPSIASPGRPLVQLSLYNPQQPVLLDERLGPQGDLSRPSAPMPPHKPVGCEYDYPQRNRDSDSNFGTSRETRVRAGTLSRVACPSACSCSRTLIFHEDCERVMEKKVSHLIGQ